MIGKAAPAFTLDRLQGEQAQFPADFNGKVVAVLFWADWCPPCINELNLLAPVYAQYKSQGLRILAVNLRQDKAAVKNIVTQLDSAYDFLMDFDGEVAAAYGVKNLPASFIIDRAGLIKSRILGESTPETFEQIILELL